MARRSPDQRIAYTLRRLSRTADRQISRADPYRYGGGGWKAGIHGRVIPNHA